MHPAQKSLVRPSPPLFRLLSFAGWTFLSIVCLVILVNQILPLGQHPTDFCQDYIGVSRVIRGIPPYTPLRCWAGSPVYVPAPVEYDAHPPSSLLLLLPLALLPRVTATLVWSFCSLAAYLVCGFLLLRMLGWWSPGGVALFLLGSVLWQPLVLAEQVQNYPQLLSLLLVLAWLFLRRRRIAGAGGLLGIAALLKIWPLVLLLGTLVQRKWRVVVSSGLLFALGTGLALLVLGTGAFAAYLGPVRANESYWVADPGNVSLVGAIARPFVGYHGTPPLPPIFPGPGLNGAVLFGEGVAGLLYTGMAVILWRLYRTPQNHETDFLSYGLWITLGVLVFPVMLYWNLILLLIPGTALLLALRHTSKPPACWRVLLALSLGPLLFPGWLTNSVPTWLEQQGTGFAGLATLFVSLPTLALLLFVVAQAWLLWRSVHTSTDPTETNVVQS